MNFQIVFIGVYMSALSQFLRHMHASIVSAFKLQRSLEIKRLALEKTRSTEALVAGMAKKSRAMAETAGCTTE